MSNLFFIFQGINAHTEDLLRNPSYIQEAKAKGLVIFCWGDDTNDPENRKKLKEFGVNGLIYDRYLFFMKNFHGLLEEEKQYNYLNIYLSVKFFQTLEYTTVTWEVC